MAALDDISIHPSEVEALVTPNDARVFIRQIFWEWFETEKDKELTTIHVWIFRRTIRVGDLREVFEALFGR